MTATLSLDLDDLWAYLRAHGDPGWEAAPSMLPAVVDRLLPLLRELDLTVTVFVVGRDLARLEARAVVAAFADAGHEISSHSFEHRADLSARSGEEIATDLSDTSKVIAGLTGTPPRGFRCPSFGVSPTLLACLVRDGYHYDASLLPTSLGPLLRLLHRASMSTDARQREQHAGMFGSAGNALLPLRPFRWQINGRTLLELPISTFPLLRTPFHMSYLHVLASRSGALARSYFNAALHACRVRGITPSFLLHPTDVLDVSDAPPLSYFAGMARPWPRKLALVRDTLTRLGRDFRVLPLGQLADELAGATLQTRKVPV